jgi:hypothetical protein
VGRKAADAIALQAIDLEGEDDLAAAALAWRRAALGSRLRKREYTERAERCEHEAARRGEPRVEAAPEVSPEASASSPSIEEAKPEAPPKETREQKIAAKQIDAAHALEKRGELERAAVTWEIAAHLAPESAVPFLERARILREQRAAEPPPEKKPEPKKKERDPRLPLPGVRMNRDVSGGYVVVQFNEASVILLMADEKHRRLVGQEFTTVSGLARAYCGRNCNGYEWLGLEAKAPEQHLAEAAQSSSPVPPTLAQEAQERVVGSERIRTKVDDEYLQECLSVAAKRIAEVFGDLAIALERK